VTCSVVCRLGGNGSDRVVVEGWLVGSSDHGSFGLLLGRVTKAARRWRSCGRGLAIGSNDHTLGH
jgi:hypothetical protein